MAPAITTGQLAAGLTARLDGPHTEEDAVASTASGRQAWTLPGRPESVRTSRELVRTAAGDDDQVEAAALCVSELVTNALVHSCSGLPGGTVTVQFEKQPSTRALRIAVHDDGALALAADRGDTGLPGAAERGYGLGIVAAIATEWGTDRDADGRPMTWCVIAPGGSPT